LITTHEAIVLKTLFMVLALNCKVLALVLDSVLKTQSRIKAWHKVLQ